MAITLSKIPVFRTEIEGIVSDLTLMLDGIDTLVSSDHPESAKVAGVQALVDLYLPEN